jgi:hypothetical protein
VAVAPTDVRKPTAETVANGATTWELPHVNAAPGGTLSRVTSAVRGRR